MLNLSNLWLLTFLSVLKELSFVHNYETFCICLWDICHFAYLDVFGKLHAAPPPHPPAKKKKNQALNEDFLTLK